ncbi:MAG: HAMP domain-containing histidine kinase [Gemmatimonadota bacterium]|jgi:signal transduction histidine kinase|nr:HAMP domain-containing histidine kinase [Gemmatimonadota bacterium]
MKGISVRLKVFLLFSVGTLLTVLPALALIARAVEERVYERATGELVAANEALRAYWRVQDDALLETARRVALERGIADNLQSGDTVTLRRTLRRYVVPRLEVFAIDSTGMSVAGPALETSTMLGTQEGSIVAFTEGTRVPIRLSVWPVWTDSVYVGIVGVGSRLDETIVRELKDVTGGAEVALVVGDSVLTTTLPDSLVSVLGSMELPAVIERGGIWRRVVERLPYLYYSSGLPVRGTGAGILLLRPVAQELRLAQSVRSSVLGIGVTALLVGLGLAFFVARIVARPAQSLASAATELARGNYDAPLPRASSDEVGQLTHAFGEMRSAIAEREERLRSAQAELIHREKLAAMGRLVAQLSHEINNPIYNIQNCLEVLDRRSDPSDPNHEFLTLAREELQRMAQLTRQLLDQSRPLSDAATPINMNQLVQRVVTLAAGELAENGIDVEYHLAPDLPVVVAHSDAMQQVLINLVDNAVDAMPDGGTLHIRTRAEAGAVEAVIEDTGTGIPAEHLPRIFEAFYTTKPGIRGVGIGLFVSEGIVRGHQGELRVENGPDGGARFVIRLPREILTVGPETAVDADRKWTT